MHKNIENGKIYLPFSIITCIIIGLSDDSPILLFSEAMAMIRNLNQMTFQGFGTIPPERAQNLRNLDKGIEYSLTGNDAQVYRAASETWISSGTGTSILSVSRDGNHNLS